MIMEKYKKVCKDVKPVGDPDQYGNQAFVITFSDDSNGFFRCKEQDLFQVGVESDFYMGKETGKSGKEYSKIQRVSAVEKDWDNTEKKSSTGSISGSGRGLSKEDKEQINRSVAIKAVCDLRNQTSNYTIERVIEEAEQLFDYINFGVSGKSDKALTEQADAHKKTLEQETNELPF